MRRNRAEGRPVVHLDETWCNAHDGKIKQWLEKDPTCHGGTIRGPKGYVNFIKASILIQIIIASHQGKGNIS